MNRFLPLLVIGLALGTQGRVVAQEPAKGGLFIATASTSATSVPAQPTSPTDGVSVDQKLKNIFLSLDFSPGTTIEQATTFLSIESKRLDPDRKGVNFIIQQEASASAKPISLTLNNVPLRDAVRYVCLLANVKYKVRDHAVSIVPMSQNTDDLIKRTFIVQPNFVEPPSNVGLNSATTPVSGTSK